MLQLPMLLATAGAWATGAAVSDEASVQHAPSCQAGCQASWSLRWGVFGLLSTSRHHRKDSIVQTAKGVLTCNQALVYLGMAKGLL